MMGMGMGMEVVIVQNLPALAFSPPSLLEDEVPPSKNTISSYTPRLDLHSS